MEKVCWHVAPIDSNERSLRSIDRYLLMFIILFLFAVERGKFLALDLGGTNFRVLIIHLKGENEFQMQSKIYAIPQNIMLGSGIQLFDHIAECLSNFMKVKMFGESFKRGGGKRKPRDTPLISTGTQCVC